MAYSIILYIMLISFNEIIEKYGINPKGVVHTGANYGEDAKEYMDAGVENVIWIESNPEKMDKLIENVSSFKNFNPFLVLNLSLSDEDNSNTKTLNSLFKDFDLSEYTFLNANIEGELKILKGATEILHNFECLYLDVYNDKLLEIDDFLNDFNFSRVQTESCAFDWGDAIYLKK